MNMTLKLGEMSATEQLSISYFVRDAALADWCARRLAPWLRGVVRRVAAAGGIHGTDNS